MKKLTLMRLGAVAVLVIFAPFVSAQQHKNQAFVPAAASVTQANPASAAMAQTPVAASAPVVATVVVGGAEDAPTGRHDFVVRMSDVNFRQMITRWAKESGWNSDWQVDGDITISGEYTWHDTDFVSAVRSTLQTTEGGETPVHGCYYSNNWVKVVPLTTQCTKQ